MTEMQAMQAALDLCQFLNFITVGVSLAGIAAGVTALVVGA